NYLLRNERGLEIENGSNGQELTFVKPWYQWSVSEGFKAFMAKLAGRTELPQGKFTVNEQDRQMAAKERFKKLSTAALLSIANAPREGEADMRGRTVRVVKDAKSGTLSLLEVAAGASPRDQAAAPAAAPAPGAKGEAPSSRLFAKPSKGDAVDVTDLVSVR